MWKYAFVTSIFGGKASVPSLTFFQNLDGVPNFQGQAISCITSPVVNCYIKKLNWLTVANNNHGGTLDKKR